MGAGLQSVKRDRNLFKVHLAMEAFQALPDRFSFALVLTRHGGTNAGTNMAMKLYGELRPKCTCFFWGE